MLARLRLIGVPSKTVVAPVNVNLGAALLTVTVTESRYVVPDSVAESSSTYTPLSFGVNVKFAAVVEAANVLSAMVCPLVVVARQVIPVAPANTVPANVIGEPSKTV